MNIIVKQINIDEQTLVPTLNIQAEVKFYYPLEIPISVTGTLRTFDQKIIAYLNESPLYHNYNKEMRAKLLDEKKKQEAFAKSNNSDNYMANLTAVLSPLAIDHIEACRHKYPNNDVMLFFSFFYKTIDFLEQSEDFTLNFKIATITTNYEIKHSDWVNKYASSLGIGNFLLVELNIPEKRNVKENWKELYTRLSERLDDIHNNIIKGEWYNAMLSARRFYDIIKIDDDKPGNAEFVEELKALFKLDGHNDEGINNFLEGIWKFFEFLSKYIHEKDKNGNLKPVPVAGKEDAYMAYALGLSLLNIIGKKIAKN
jgi:hypothetical protein